MNKQRKIKGGSANCGIALLYFGMMAFVGDGDLDVPFDEIVADILSEIETIKCTWSGMIIY